MVIVAAALILALSTQTSLAHSLDPTEFTHGDTAVYGIDGYAPNLTISLDQPIFTANSTIISFTIEILEPFSARGTVVNQSDYYVYRKSLDFYLTSGIVTDYDRTRLIDTLWLNWGNSLNETHVQEEKTLYSQIYWVNLTKSDNRYFGTAILPKLSANVNATIWVRAEQDQVTTYIPFWLAVGKTTLLSSTPLTPTPLTTPTSTLSPTPSPSPTQTPTLDPTLSPTQNATVSPIVEPNSIWMAYQLEAAAIIIIIAVATVAISALAYRKIKKQKQN